MGSKQNSWRVMLACSTLAFLATNAAPLASQANSNIPARPITHAGSWSPDGARFLYGSDETGSRQIWVMSVDGSDKRRLSGNDAVEGFAHFTPDGRSIVFTSNEGGNSDIWIMAADGTDRRRLTDTPQDEVMPRPSPDGRSIYFSRGESRGPPKSIYRINIDGSEETRLSKEANQIYPSLSPVDGRLLSAGNLPGAPATRIYIRSNETAEPAAIAEEIGLASYNPDWSPDGQWVAFVSQSQASIATAAIWIVRADDSEAHMLVKFPEGVFGPRWSPDGQSISFRRGWTSPHVGLFRIKTDGTGLVQLTNADWPAPGDGTESGRSSGSEPQDEKRSVVFLAGAFGREREALPDQSSGYLGRRTSSAGPQPSPDPLGVVALAGRVTSLGQAVGAEQIDVTGRDLHSETAMVGLEWLAERQAADFELLRDPGTQSDR